MLTSLMLWASNNGTGLNLSDAQMAAEGRFLQSRLEKLEKDLDKAVQETCKEIKEVLAENIFDHYDHVVDLAVEKANSKPAKWFSPVNRVCCYTIHKAFSDRSLGQSRCRRLLLGYIQR